jgi:hypothetical protein
MKLDPINPTDDDRLLAFNYWLALNCHDDADDSEAVATADGCTITDADGFTCWVLTRQEIEDASLWSDDLDSFHFKGCEWVVMPV